MSDADLTEFVKLSKPRKAPCKVGWVIDQLKPKEKKDLLAAIATDKSIITAGAIVEWLKRRGFELSPQNVFIHRVGRCSCREQ